ncbi:MAG: zinc-dependent metalloprotease [Bacteroidales bacterium]|nr:zinc-dependent metalloprotease [Bacteroidales bacterium]
MKTKTIFALLIGTFITQCAFAQGYKLISPKIQVQKKIDSNTLPQRLESYQTIEFVNIDVSQITQQENFLLEYDNKTLSMNRKNIKVRGEDDFCFWGYNDEGYSLFLSIIGNDIQGVIEGPKGNFSIETIGEKSYALVKFDPSKMPNDCATIDDDNSKANLDDESSFPHAPTLLSLQNRCKIRVLVLYTPKAQSMVSNIKNTILKAVELSNESFTNSNIQQSIELVYIGKTNYAENEFHEDLKNFKSTNDGIMDEVHTLRNLYSADVCVLLIYDPALCGLAAGIGVEANNAFCVVSVAGGCATTNYSFVHEIGHLLGCRHDIAMDDTKTPFTYGHGYIAPSKEWRTIMAYRNDCGTCPRLNYWSNPDVLYNGVPMGTSSLQNNARVWNEQSNKVINFRQVSSSVTLNKEGFTNTQYADIVAKKEIILSGDINVSSTCTLNVKAGENVSIQEGFNIEEGATLDISIEEIPDCSNN